MENYNSKIIDKIIEHNIPNKKSLVIYLMKMFAMSKETAYRRIRNQNSFSIEELVAIAKYFNLSTDELSSKSDCGYLRRSNYLNCCIGYGKC